MTRINLGSGQRPFKPPFVNVDVNAKWQPDVVADGANMPMFESGSADVIVMHHSLEHFGLGEADAVIAECRRILAPGGSLIITVPDMWALAKGWMQGAIDDYAYFVNVYGAYMGDEADRHKWGYRGQSLKDYLRRVQPWAVVKAFDWRGIEGADTARDWWILGVEAVK